MAIQRSRFILRTASVSLVALALAACSALPRPPEQPTRYDLGLADAIPALTDASAPAARQPPLVLAEVQAPGLADGATAMSYRLAYANGQELRNYQNARWSRPPAQLVEQRLRVRLGAQRPLLVGLDNVSAADPQSAAAGLLRVEVDEFSQVFDSAASSNGVVRLRASLTGFDKKGVNVLLGQQVFTVKVPATSADAAGGAKALAAATDEASVQLNRWLLSLRR